MHLEIAVITYNRSSFLSKTLTYLANSKLKDCKITVLNNCSTDNTLEVCKNFESLLSNLRVVSHSHNIGICANLIRALEISNMRYTWVLCDDDVVDLTHFDDVESIMADGKVDLIHVGGHPLKPWSFGGSLNTVKQIYERGYNYFKYSSFLPANIFRTDKLQSESLIAGYDNIINGYPHMPYLFSLYENNNLMYVSKHRIVTARMEGQSYSSSTWFRWWINTCQLLRNKVDVRKAFLDQWKDIGDGNDQLGLDALFNFNEYHNPDGKQYVSKFINDYLVTSDKYYLYKLSFNLFLKYRKNGTLARLKKITGK